MPPFRRHTNFWESREIARLLAARGYEVDIVDHYNTSFLPKGRYDILIDIQNAFERCDDFLASGGLRIAHLTAAHWLTQKLARIGAAARFYWRGAV